MRPCWVRCRLVVGPSWVASGSVLHAETAENKAKTRCSTREENVSDQKRRDMHQDRRSQQSEVRSQNAGGRRKEMTRTPSLRAQFSPLPAGTSQARSGLRASLGRSARRFWRWGSGFSRQESRPPAKARTPTDHSDGRLSRYACRLVPYYTNPSASGLHRGPPRRALKPLVSTRYINSQHRAPRRETRRAVQQARKTNRKTVTNRDNQAALALPSARGRGDRFCIGALPHPARPAQRVGRGGSGPARRSRSEPCPITRSTSLYY